MRREIIMNRLEEFKKYQAQTTPLPAGTGHRQGRRLVDIRQIGKAKYLDLEAGVSANVIGHSNPRVVKAIKEQVERGTCT